MSDLEKKFLYFYTCGFFIVFLIWNIAIIFTGLRPSALVNWLFFDFYKSDAIHCEVLTLTDEKPLFPVLYFSIVESSLLALLLFLFIFKKSIRGQPLRKTFLYAVIFACILTSVFQTTTEIRNCYFSYKPLTRLNLEQKQEDMFKSIYRFSNFVKEALPGTHNAKLITEIDLSCDPGMWIHRVLAYFIWPVDIRGVRSGKADAVIVMNVKNPNEAIPDGFSLLKQYNEFNLIAVRDIK